MPIDPSVENLLIWSLMSFDPAFHPSKSSPIDYLLQTSPQTSVFFHPGLYTEPEFIDLLIANPQFIPKTTNAVYYTYFAGNAGFVLRALFRTMTSIPSFESLEQILSNKKQPHFENKVRGAMINDSITTYNLNAQFLHNWKIAYPKNAERFSKEKKVLVKDPTKMTPLSRAHLLEAGNFRDILDLRVLLALCLINGGIDDVDSLKIIRGLVSRVRNEQTMTQSHGVWWEVFWFVSTLSEYELLKLGWKSRTRLFSHMTRDEVAIFLYPRITWADAPGNSCLSTVEKTKIQNWVRDNYLPRFPIQFFCDAACDDKTGMRCDRFSYRASTRCLFHQDKTKFPRTFASAHNRIGGLPDVTATEYEQAPQQQSGNNDSILRYPDTQRPVNPMRELLGEETKTSNSFKPGFYLPVGRYEAVYYSGVKEKGQPSPQKKYCGKFFFYEPKSTVLLHLGKACFFATKVHAYMRLKHMLRFVKNIPLEERRKAANSEKWSKEKLLKARQHGFISVLHDFMDEIGFERDGSQFFDAGDSNHPQQLLSEYPLTLLAPLSRPSIFKPLVDLFRDQLQAKGFDEALLEETRDSLDFWLTFHFRTLFFKFEEAVNNIKSRKELPIFYPTDDASSFPKGRGVGMFDVLDQPICNMAKLLGFDTILLQHEIGGHDCVTEIIHTGDYRAALFRVGAIQSLLDDDGSQTNLKYAKIWFPRQQGVVQVKVNNPMLPRLLPIVPQDEYVLFPHVQLNEVFENTPMEIYVDPEDVRNNESGSDIEEGEHEEPEKKFGFDEEN